MFPPLPLMSFFSMVISFRGNMCMWQRDRRCLLQAISELQPKCSEWLPGGFWLFSLTGSGRGHISVFLELQMPKGDGVETILGTMKWTFRWKPVKCACLQRQCQGSEVFSSSSAWVSWRRYQWGQVITLFQLSLNPWLSSDPCHCHGCQLALVMLSGVYDGRK